MQKLARVVSLAVGHRFDGQLVLPKSLKTAPHLASQSGVQNALAQKPIKSKSLTLVYICRQPIEVL